MAKIIWRKKAINDLNAIWNYTFEKWSEKQADKYYASIKFTIKQIGENPKLGRLYYEIDEDIYGLKSGRHIIFYQQISGSEIDIVRIFTNEWI